MPAPSPRIAVVLTIGGIAGFLSGLFGIGGGIVMVPLLILVAGFSQQHAAATSLAAIIPTAAVAASTYVASGAVPANQFGFGLVLAGGAAVLAPFGSRALRTWNVSIVRWAFIAMLAVTAIVIFVTIPERAEQLEWTFPTVVTLLGIGAVMGFAAGLLGVGGGILAVPILILIGVSDLTAKTLSLIAMVPAAVAGTIGSHRAQLVEWSTVLPLGITTALVAPLGVWASVALPPAWANPLLAALIVYAALQLTVRAIRDARRG